ncbi:hypothetical protein [Vibrio sp. WXL103]|uniref:hypothetical protein n=1 Tax=Vibrio sp. WXL103 TaxID=3450710 RepID=UPI003EC819AA
MSRENSLAQQIEKLGFNPDSLPSVSGDSEQALSQLLTQMQPLYAKVRAQKPEMTELDALLGLFSYQHQSLITEFDQQVDALVAMKSVLADNLSQSDQDKFSAPIIAQLWLTTQLWLFIQGCQNLDYSLANDHALATARRLAEPTDSDINALRSELTRYYYQGIKHYQNTNPSTAWWKRWFEKWLN